MRKTRNTKQREKYKQKNDKILHLSGNYSTTRLSTVHHKTVNSYQYNILYLQLKFIQGIKASILYTFCLVFCTRFSS